MLYIAILAIFVALLWPRDPSCRKHGKEHLYRHGYYDEVDCLKCWEEMKKTAP